MAKGKTRPKKVGLVPSHPADHKPIVDPRGSLPGHETSSDRICWRFRHLDEAGPWSMSGLDASTRSAVLSSLCNFETMTMHELFRRGDEPGKEYEVAAIPNPDALARLEELQLSDMTQIARLRIGGTGRLYGFLIDHVFHVVWWDPTHEIWPSQKKHT